MIQMYLTAERYDELHRCLTMFSIDLKRDLFVAHMDDDLDLAEGIEADLRMVERLLTVVPSLDG